MIQKQISKKSNFQCILDIIIYLLKTIQDELQAYFEKNFNFNFYKKYFFFISCAKYKQYKNMKKSNVCYIFKLKYLKSAKLNLRLV